MATVVSGMSFACGPLGLARALSPHCDGIGPWQPPPMDLKAMATILALGIAVPLVAETVAVAAIGGMLRRGIQGFVAVFKPNAVRRRVFSVIGTVSLLMLVFFLIQGVGGAESKGEKVYRMARAGAEMVPGPIGYDMRFMVDELAIGKLKKCSAPVFLNNTDVSRLRASLGDPRDIDIGDSGAAVHVVTDTKNAVPGSVRKNDLAVHTANGAVTPPLKCDVVRSLRCTNGELKSVMLTGALVMEDCSHNLISLGKLAREQGIGLTLGAGDDASSLNLPGGITAPVLNLGIIIIPPSKAYPAQVNVIARAARTNKHLKGSTVHARGNHTPARVLRDWHRCTSDIPIEWSKAVKDEPCDSCLEGVCDEVPSDRHVRVVEEPGDLVSYDVFSMGVKHVHGSQTKVFGAHDQKSKLNWVKLLPNESGPEIAKALREFNNYCISHKVVIRHIHTDNAKAHLCDETVEVVRDVIKA